MRGEQVFHGLGADAPFERAVDVWVEFFGSETRAFVERQMQPEQAPRGVLEAVELPEKGGRKMPAPDQALESRVHVKRGSHELRGPNRLAADQLDAGGAPVLDEDAIDVHLRLEGASGGDEGFHQAARQIERSALAKLIAALQVEGTDHRAHRRGL